LSTKLRILIQKRGHRPITGARAIKFMLNIVRGKMLNMMWPPEWEQMSKQSKLEFLAKHLPEDTRLMLIREQRWTRKSRSLYVKMLGDTSHQRRMFEEGEGMDEGFDEFTGQFDSFRTTPLYRSVTSGNRSHLNILQPPITYTTTSNATRDPQFRVIDSSLGGNR
jgi:hypothetical protein